MTRSEPSGERSRSEERAAQNQVRFREANEKIDARRRELGVEEDMRFPVLCECDDATCTEILHVSPREYEATREHVRRFLLVDGHQGDAYVVSWHDGYVVVEKEGREAEHVEALTE